MKPRFLLNNTVTKRDKKNMTKGWTMVVCFSRAWCVRPFFADFERLDFDRSKCHLIIYNNTNDPFLDKLLLTRARRYQQYHRQTSGARTCFKPFASVRYYKSFRQWGGIVFGQEVSFDASKLPAILAMYMDVTGMLTTKTFFLIEDDTLVPPHAVQKLFTILHRNKNIGIASGVEPTRSPRLTDKARIGAYWLLRPGDQILERTSVSPGCTGHFDVDAVGFYCLAARTAAWKQGLDLFRKCFDNQLPAEPNWAIDTLWTNDVKRSGWRVIADMDTPCLHMQTVGPRIYNWAIDRAVVKIDVFLEKYGVYAQGVELK